MTIKDAYKLLEQHEIQYESVSDLWKQLDQFLPDKPIYSAILRVIDFMNHGR